MLTNSTSIHAHKIINEHRSRQYNTVRQIRSSCQELATQFMLKTVALLHVNVKGPCNMSMLKLYVILFSSNTQSHGNSYIYQSTLSA